MDGRRLDCIINGRVLGNAEMSEEGERKMSRYADMGKLVGCTYCIKSASKKAKVQGKFG